MSFATKDSTAIPRVYKKEVEGFKIYINLSNILTEIAIGTYPAKNNTKTTKMFAGGSTNENFKSALPSI